MAPLPLLFGALAVLCALDAALVASLADRSEPGGPDARDAAGLCGLILACGVVCLVAARVAS